MTGEKPSDAPEAGDVKKRLSTRWKVVIGVVAALLVLWVASEIVIPRVASSYVENRIRKKYPEATSVSVSMSAFPAVRMAFRDYSNLTVKVRGVTLEDISFDAIVLESRKWPRGTFAATVLPSEMMRFFSATHSYVRQPALSLDGDAIKVTGRIDVGYATVDVVATGNLESRRGKQIFFVPDNVATEGVNNKAKAEAAVRDTMAASPVFVVRSDLPFDVTTITAGGGRLKVVGTVDLSRALNIKL